MDLLDTLAAVINQAWADDYPPELAPVDIKGRKNWRKDHLVRLIQKQFCLCDAEAERFKQLVK